ncbi:MAG: cell division protein FtsA [Firmicutes bacterium]|nr:cell division protein FtsA [Bacillota bacterium]
MPDKPYVINPDHIIFALDIGTRTVVGLACYPEEDNLRILDIEFQEHPERDMLDGQIHNIAGVAETAKQVKERLENKLQVELNRVSVSVAGRTLTTLRRKAKKILLPEHRILPEEILSLELEAVKKAQDDLSNNDVESSHYCVGYTTVQYLLDGYPISNLVSQKGQRMETDVLATFLPNAVVDSLLTVIEMIGLSLHSLTLEPIAAMHALIPPEYRLLNIALLDIGAGTSDIAITNEGSIIAYAMVPMAGDEITEKLAAHYLLDFQSAEKLKLKTTSPEEQYTFKDIIGNTIRAAHEEIIQVIEPVMDEITEQIYKTILHYNKKEPSALFCIGGGSKTLMLREKLAEKFGLPRERVAIRDFESLKNIVYSGEKLKGPECITPMGIALSSRRKKYFGFSYVTVNGKVVRLLETEPTSIGRVLIVAGYSPRSLIALRGTSKTILVGGREKIYPGKPGKNAIIRLNGEPASLDTIVQSNDEIMVEPATPGEEAVITVQDVINHDHYYVFVKQKKIKIRPHVTVNEEHADKYRELSDGDVVKIENFGTLADLRNYMDAGIYLPAEGITINGKSVNDRYHIKPLDRIDWNQRETTPLPQL